MTDRDRARRRFLRFGVAGMAAVLVPSRGVGAAADDAGPRAAQPAHRRVRAGDVLGRRPVPGRGAQPDRPRSCATIARNDVHPIDRRLLSLLDELHGQLDTREPFEVISGYRSPATNATLVSTTNGVSPTSLHVVGMAIDIRVPGRPLRAVRDTARELRAGGVGYYPDSDFVHVDVGRVRTWSHRPGSAAS